MMIWCVVLAVIAAIILLLLTWLATRGKVTDIPQGWHPPGDHVASWIDEHDDGKPRYGPRDGGFG